MLTRRRIAAVYDIHGNLPALEAVLSEILDAGADEIVVGGDVVPGPLPSECLEALDACARTGVPVTCIRGNGEADLLTMSRGAVPERVPEPFRPAVGATLDRLSPDRLAEIRSWPGTVRRAVEGLGSILFCHATPDDDNALFTRVTPDDALRGMAAAAAADVLVCGHTHMQFDRCVGDTRIVNAGSVGMPFGPPGAFWCLLSDRGVELRTTDYDRSAAEARLARTGFPLALQLVSPPDAEEMEQRFEQAAIPGRR